MPSANDGDGSPIRCGADQTRNSIPIAGSRATAAPISHVASETRLADARPPWSVVWSIFEIFNSHLTVTGPRDRRIEGKALPVLLAILICGAVIVALALILSAKLPAASVSRLYEVVAWTAPHKLSAGQPR
jgi:hypothetical protein